MAASVAAKHTYRTLFEEARDPTTPERMRVIALGQIVEQLRVNGDRNQAFYDINLVLAREVTDLIAELPATWQNDELLKAGLRQVTKRLRPNQVEFKASSALVELRAAEAAARYAFRCDAAPEAFNPLIEILREPLKTSSPQAERYADAAQVLLSSVGGDEALQQKVIKPAYQAINNPVLEYHDRLHRIVNVFLHAPKLQRANDLDFQLLFRHTVYQMALVNQSRTIAELDFQETRLAEAGRPELILHLIVPGRTALTNSSRHTDQCIKPEQTLLEILHGYCKTQPSVTANTL